MEVVLIMLQYPNMWNILAHTRMLRHTEIVHLVFEWLDVEFVTLYNCQHKICPECSVFLSPEYAILNELEWKGWTGENKSFNFPHNIVKSVLSNFQFSTLKK